ncbi:MAG: hypothetical protein EU539_08450 [Promethearchaeota archaeon]|nr:MAG: hypothetical protein EU539_08450 [Candidatus Lokiarchaeota archaeon]
MTININPEIIDAFEKVRKIYLFEKFENPTERTEDILRKNLANEDYLVNIKSTIDLIIESKLENSISDFEELFNLPNFERELTLIKSYLIDLLKGDPDVECIKCFFVFNVNEGILKFGWNYSIFKRDIDLLVGLFTAITSFSQEAVERQLKGLSLEGMEFKMIPFQNEDLAILFILSRNPSALLIKRMDEFRDALENEFGDLFTKMAHIDFTEDKNIREKTYDLMVKILKFDMSKLKKMDETVNYSHK